MERYVPRCIFCGSSKDMTGEHMFAAGLHRKYKFQHIPRTTFHNKILTHNADGSISEEIFPDATGRPIHSLKTRKICKNCNGGWMGNLEDRIQNLLDRLNKALLWVQLSDNEIADLQQWAMLLAIKWETRNQHLRCIPDSEHYYLYKNRTPPENWKIWIGRAAKQDKISAYHSSILSKNATPFADSQFSAQATSFCIGPIYILALSSTPETVEKFWKAGTSISKSALHKIHPLPCSKAINFKSMKEIDSDLACCLSHTFGDLTCRNLELIEYRIPAIEK